MRRNGIAYHSPQEDEDWLIKVVLPAQLVNCQLQAGRALEAGRLANEDSGKREGGQLLMGLAQGLEPGCASRFPSATVSKPERFHHPAVALLQPLSLKPRSQPPAHSLLSRRAASAWPPSNTDGRCPLACVHQGMHMQVRTCGRSLNRGSRIVRHNRELQRRTTKSVRHSLLCATSYYIRSLAMGRHCQALIRLLPKSLNRSGFHDIWAPPKI